MKAQTFFEKHQIGATKKVLCVEQNKHFVHYTKYVILLWLQAHLPQTFVISHTHVYIFLSYLS